MRIKTAHLILFLNVEILCVSVACMFSAQSKWAHYEKMREVDQAAQEVVESLDRIQLIDPIEELHDAINKDLTALELKYNPKNKS
jgi:hypothetical protein